MSRCCIYGRMVSKGTIIIIIRRSTSNLDSAPSLSWQRHHHHTSDENGIQWHLLPTLIACGGCTAALVQTCGSRGRMASEAGRQPDRQAGTYMMCGVNVLTCLNKGARRAFICTGIASFPFIYTCSHICNHACNTQKRVPVCGCSACVLGWSACMHAPGNV